jgi:hypothetical protein
MQSVVILNVTMLSVMAPLLQPLALLTNSVGCKSLLLNNGLAYVGEYLKKVLCDCGQVSSHCFADLESTALEWMTNSMTLQQLRKG